MAVASAFFRDSGDRWATFDWLIRNDENYAKVLEGRYANEDKTHDDHGRRETQASGGQRRPERAGMPVGNATNTSGRSFTQGEEFHA